MSPSVPTDFQRRVDQATPEQKAVIERVLSGELFPGALPPQAPQCRPVTSQSSRAAAGFVATIEGHPTSGHFCIRVAPANEPSQKASPEDVEPTKETLSLAAKVFELLSALDPGKRIRKAPPITVFLLRYLQNYSLADIARGCGCAKSLVKLRLKALGEALPWKPQQLRELSAHVGAMQDALTDSRARSIYRRGAVHGDEEDDNGCE
jgi:hypothetical protein